MSAQQIGKKAVSFFPPTQMIININKIELKFNTLQNTMELYMLAFFTAILYNYRQTLVVNCIIFIVVFDFTIIAIAYPKLKLIHFFYIRYNILLGCFIQLRTPGKMREQREHASEKKKTKLPKKIETYQMKASKTLTGRKKR